MTPDQSLEAFTFLRAAFPGHRQDQADAEATQRLYVSEMAWHSVTAASAAIKLLQAQQYFPTLGELRSALVAASKAEVIRSRPVTTVPEERRLEEPQPKSPAAVAFAMLAKKWQHEVTMRGKPHEPCDKETAARRWRELWQTWAMVDKATEKSKEELEAGF